MTIETPIADLGLRPSVVAALAKDGIVCVGDLTVLTEPELRRVPHIGPKSLADIKAILDGMGLRLHDPELGRVLINFRQRPLRSDTDRPCATAANVAMGQIGDISIRSVSLRHLRLWPDCLQLLEK